MLFCRLLGWLIYELLSLAQPTKDTELPPNKQQV
jgi:hypothetical protein